MLFLHAICLPSPMISMSCISILHIINLLMLPSRLVLNFVVVDAPSTLYCNADSDISVALLLQAKLTIIIYVVDTYNFIPFIIVLIPSNCTSI